MHRGRSFAESSEGSSANAADSFSFPPGMIVMPPENPVQGTGAALSRRMWKSSEGTNNCRVCGKDFKLFSKKHHCRHCGEVVCGDCSKGKVHLETFKGQRKAMRVCTSCEEKYEADRLHPLYIMLGDRLGSLYFYELTRNGDDDIDQLSEAARDPEIFDLLLERNHVMRKHRKDILDRIPRLHPPPASVLSGGRADSAAGGTSESSDTEDEESEEFEEDEEADCSSPSFASPTNGTGRPRKRKGAGSAKKTGDLVKADGAVKNWTQKGLSALKIGKKGNGMSLAMMLREKGSLEEKIKAQKKELAELEAMKKEVEGFHRGRVEQEAEAKERRAREQNAKVDVLKKIKRRRRAFDINVHHKDECDICRAAYGAFNKEHHCRSCYRSVCNPCSMPRLGDQRCCDFCHAEATLASKALISSASCDGRQRDYWTSTLESCLNSFLALDPPAVAKRAKSMPGETQAMETPSQSPASPSQPREGNAPVEPSPVPPPQNPQEEAWAPAPTA